MFTRHISLDLCQTLVVTCFLTWTAPRNGCRAQHSSALFVYDTPCRLGPMSRTQMPYLLENRGGFSVPALIVRLPPTPHTHTTERGSWPTSVCVGAPPKGPTIASSKKARKGLRPATCVSRCVGCWSDSRTKTTAMFLPSNDRRLSVCTPLSCERSRSLRARSTNIGQGERGGRVVTGARRLRTVRTSSKAGKQCMPGGHV